MKDWWGENEPNNRRKTYNRLITDTSSWNSLLKSERTNSGNNRSGLFVIRFTHKEFLNIDFSKIKFEVIDFISCNFINCNFNESIFLSSVIQNCNFKDCFFNKTEFIKTSLKVISENTIFKNCIFSKISGFGGSYLNCDFSKTKFVDGGFEATTFKSCILREVSFGKNNLPSVTWDTCKIDGHTNFKETLDLNTANLTRDKSETTKYAIGRGKLFNWRTTRAIAFFPILGFSWTVFLISLFAVNAIGAINDLTPPLLQGMENIPIPHDILWIIISSFLMAIGSTIYAIFCPEQVKAFSETQWVYEHKHARMEYLVSALQKPVLVMISNITLVTGMLIGLYLAISRIVHAFHYFMSYN